MEGPSFLMEFCLLQTIQQIEMLQETGIKRPQARGSTLDIL